MQADLDPGPQTLALNPAHLSHHRRLSAAIGGMTRLRWPRRALAAARGCCSFAPRTIRARVCRRWPIGSSRRRARVGAQVIINDRADIARLVQPTASTLGRRTFRSLRCEASSVRARSSGFRHTTNRIDEALLATRVMSPSARSFHSNQGDWLHGAWPGSRQLCGGPRQANCRDRRYHARAIGRRRGAGASALAVISDLFTDDPETRVRAFVGRLPAPPFKVY